MNNNLQTAKKLRAFAHRLASQNDSRAEELLRVAQLLDGGGAYDLTYQGQGFGGGNIGVENYRAEGDGGQKAEFHPGIDSFVKIPDNAGAPPEDDRITHNLSLSLKAPKGVAESDMMNFMLGIRKALDVEVESFNWAKKDPKPSGRG